MRIPLPVAIVSISRISPRTSYLTGTKISQRDSDGLTSLTLSRATAPAVAHAIPISIWRNDALAPRKFRGADRAPASERRSQRRDLNHEYGFDRLDVKRSRRKPPLPDGFTGPPEKDWILRRKARFRRRDITADATGQRNTRGAVDCGRTLLPRACHGSLRKRRGKGSCGSAFGEPPGLQRPARVHQFEGIARSIAASYALQM
jgi:hypothetical protein